MARVAAEFLKDYILRNPRSAAFAENHVGHVVEHLGKLMTANVSAATVTGYQTARINENASPKSINEETGLLLRMLGEQGNLLRTRLKREHALKLKVRKGVAKAFASEEKAAMLVAAKAMRSPAIYPALMLALHTGLRDAEIRGLQWDRVELHKAVVTVGDSKTEAGQGRTVPLNSDVLAALVTHAKWYLKKFGATEPGWYVFPFGAPQPTDPTRPMVTLKTSWAKVKKTAGVTGRWHDNRHSWVTDLAESGEASDETIRQLAGHVSKQMLAHYSHISMEAKRRAVDALVVKPALPAAAPGGTPAGPAKDPAKITVLN